MRSINTLIVDDSPAFIDATERVLGRAEGVKVVGRAASGDEAIESVRLLQPDLVLMDWSMPVMGGLEATRYLKNQSASPRIVMVTVHDAQQYRHAAQAAGADGFLCKEEIEEHLPLLIRHLFSGQ